MDARPGNRATPGRAEGGRPVSPSISAPQRPARGRAGRDRDPNPAPPRERLQLLATGRVVVEVAALLGGQSEIDHGRTPRRQARGGASVGTGDGEACSSRPSRTSGSARRKRSSRCGERPSGGGRLQRRRVAQAVGHRGRLPPRLRRPRRGDASDDAGAHAGSNSVVVEPVEAVDEVKRLWYRAAGTRGVAVGGGGPWRQPRPPESAATSTGGMDDGSALRKTMTRSMTRRRSLPQGRAGRSDVTELPNRQGREAAWA